MCKFPIIRQKNGILRSCISNSDLWERIAWFTGAHIAAHPFTHVELLCFSRVHTSWGTITQRMHNKPKVDQCGDGTLVSGGKGCQHSKGISDLEGCFLLCCFGCQDAPSLLKQQSNVIVLIDTWQMTLPEPGHLAQ